MSSTDHDAKRAKLDPSLVQITASKCAIEKRIDTFIERKQSERDASNYEQFVDRRKPAHASEGSSPFTDKGSARTDSAQLHRTAQIRVLQSNNMEGPLDTSNRTKALPTGVEGRVSVLENYLDVRTYRYNVLNAPKDVYERLQRIEDRVVELEKVAAVADLLRIHKGRGVDALLAELNSTSLPAPVAAPPPLLPAPLPLLPPSMSPATAALLATAVPSPLSLTFGTTQLSPPSPSTTHRAPPVVPEEPKPRSAPDDPKEIEARIAALKASLRRKQQEKQHHLHHHGAPPKT